MNDLISRVVAAGFQFDLDGDTPQLRPVAQGSSLPPALLEELRVNRGEVLAFLRATQRECQAQPDPEGEHCATCLATVYTRSPEVQRMCHMVACPFWTKASGVGAEWMAEARRQLDAQTRRNAG